MTMKQTLAHLLRRAAEPLQDKLFPGRISYSAAGEDRLVIAWLQNAFGLRDLSAVRYCDIGANHPRQLSNTFALYNHGASGVLVEPDPDLAARLTKARPRDTVVNAGIAFDERRTAMLKRFTSPVFNTFSTAQADVVLDSSAHWQDDQRQSVIDEISVPLLPANDVLAAHFADDLHFLSIDAEGVDLAILQSIDLDRFRPKIICIEASADFDPVLKPFGYEMLARTPDNLLFTECRRP